MGETMRQIPFEFPGEGDHADRLLRTAAYLIDRGRLHAAYEVLELVEALPLEDPCLAELARVADRLADAFRGAKVATAQLAARPARVLRFRARPAICLAAASLPGRG